MGTNYFLGKRTVMVTSSFYKVTLSTQIFRMHKCILTLHALTQGYRKSRQWLIKRRL